MKTKNFFFAKQNNIFLSDILKILGKKPMQKNYKINDISDLNTAKSNDISFFNSMRYINDLKKTKAKYIIINRKYENNLSKISNLITVDNVLKSISLITKLFYPTSLDDAIDFDVTSPKKKTISKSIIWKKRIIGQKN